MSSGRLKKRHPSQRRKEEAYVVMEVDGGNAFDAFVLQAGVLRCHMGKCCRWIDPAWPHLTKPSLPKHPHKEPPHHILRCCSHSNTNRVTQAFSHPEKDVNYLLSLCARSCFLLLLLFCINKVMIFGRQGSCWMIAVRLRQFAHCQRADRGNCEVLETFWSIKV